MPGQPKLEISLFKGRLAHIVAEGSQAVRPVRIFIWALSAVLLIFATTHSDLASYALSAGSILARLF